MLKTGSFHTRKLLTPFLSFLFSSVVKSSLFLMFLYFAYLCFISLFLCLENHTTDWLRHPWFQFQAPRANSNSLAIYWISSGFSRDSEPCLVLVVNCSVMNYPSQQRSNQLSQPNSSLQNKFHQKLTWYDSERFHFTLNGKHQKHAAASRKTMKIEIFLASV